MQKEKQAFLALAETLSSLIALIQGDKIVYMNPAGGAMLGRTAADMLGRDFWFVIHPESRDAAIERGRGRQRGEPQPKRYVERIVKPDGGAAWLDYSVDVIDLDGVTTTLVTAYDVTERKRIEGELRESEARFRAAFENAAIGKAITSLDLRLIQVNAAMCQMSGYTREELLAMERPIADLTHPDDAQVGLADLAAMLEGRQASIHVDKRYRHKNGHYFWGSTSITVVRDERGAPLYLLAETEDITERKRTQDALRASEERFRNLSMQAPVMMAGLDREGRFRDVSNAWLERMGYERSAVVGHVAGEFYTADSNARWTRAFEQRELNDDAVVRSIPMQGIRRDGAISDQIVTSVLEYDDRGEPSGVIAVAVDVSELKRTREELRESEERFRSAFENAAIGKVISATDGRYLQVNRALCEMYGYSEAELLARNVSDLTHPDDFPAARGAAHRLLSGETATMTFEKRVVRSDGRVLWVLITANLLRGPDGAPLYVISDVLDVTERRRAEAALRESEERFRNAFQNAAIGKAIASPDQRFRQVNRAYCEMFGYSESEILAMTASDITHPEDDGQSAVMIRKLLDGTLSSGHVIKRYRHKNGSVVWGDLTLTLMRDEHGAPSFFIGEIVDVTERKRAEDALRANEERFRNLWTQAPVMLAGLDRDGVVRNVSNHWLERNGYASRDEVLGRMGAEFVTPESHARLLQAFEERARSNDVAVRNIPVQGIRKDGSLFDVVLTNVVEFDDRGEPRGVIAVGVDVSELNRAREALRESEDRFRRAFANAAIGKAIGDTHGRFLQVNRAMCEMLGYSEAELLQLDVLRISHPDDLELTLAAAQKMRSGELVHASVEKRVMHRQGHAIWVHITSNAIHDAEGRPSHFIAELQDVTERKRAADALSQSEARFRGLFRDSPVMMCTVDAENRVRDVNNCWMQTFGYTREEAIGRNGFEFVTEESRRQLTGSVPDQPGPWVASMNNQPLQGVRKDGSIVDVLVTAVPELDEHGQTRGLICVSIDVTTLRETEARYRALIEYAPEAIVVYDADERRFVDANAVAERMFGMSRDALLSVGLIERSPEFQPDGRRSAEVARERIERALAGENMVFEWVHLGAGMRELPCRVHTSRLPAAGRNLLRATVIDISAEKGLESQLRHQEKIAAMGVLAAGVAHEIGNPLLAMSMAAQNLERRSTDAYAQKKLGLIREQIDRISKIVRQMNDLARPQSGERVRTSLNRTIERALELVRFDKRSRDVEIRLELPEIPSLIAIEDQITQVCLNLALNAFDAMSSNSAERARVLTVGAAVDDARVRVTFDDTGPGIAPAEQARLFQPFFTTKQPGKGTGLGLSVSQRILREHGGSLTFENHSGGGARFAFDLPLKANS